jgi:hypothetical protein
VKQKKMRKYLTILAAAIVSLGMIGTANAFVFDMGPGSWVDVSGTADPGLVMYANMNPALDSIVYNLNPGDSQTFLFATIGTRESAINNDDVVASPMTAYVDFDNPDLTQSVNGTSNGYINGFLGNHQGWTLNWADPILVNFGSGGQLSLELQDVAFGTYLWCGPDGEKNVNATVRLISASNGNGASPVPEPASMSLLGLGILGLFGLRRKRA